MKYAGLLMVAISTVSYAEDPFSCVDADVADAFLGHTYFGRGAYSTSIPDGFASLNAPAGFSLVGSEVLKSMTTVVYKTSLPAEAALDAAVDAAAESGWAESTVQHRSPRGGFQTVSRPLATLLCHDDAEGALSVIAAEKTNRTFVSYMQTSRSQSCRSKAAARSHYDPAQLMRDLPTLKLPAVATASNTGMGGDGDEVSSHVDISGAMSRTELADFFAGQIWDQGWEHQTDWASRFSSGSVWTSNSDESGVLIGTLHLYGAGDDVVRVRFSVNPADPEKGTDRGSWSSTSH